jgi:hypothetical protein
MEGRYRKLGTGTKFDPIAWEREHSYGHANVTVNIDIDTMAFLQAAGMKKKAELRVTRIWN